MGIDVLSQVVIGSGAAGLLSVIVANGLGKTCALVEQHAMGGDCLNVGCVPSKVKRYIDGQSPRSATLMLQSHCVFCVCRVVLARNYSSSSKRCSNHKNQVPIYDHRYDWYQLLRAIE